jgi:threonylcarbamoyladenosine tRNA methylthiotransferase MtaB
MAAGHDSDVAVVTFGCRLNAYESEVMRRHAAEAGLDNAVIVNTCAVTAEAERQARQAIRRARRERPDARIIVTGCAAQIDPARYAALPEVDQVVGNTEKLEAATFGIDDAPRVRVNDIMAVEETAAHLIDGLEGRARAFLQVQQGCDHRCTFCIIPYGRGPSRSVPMGAIAEEARRLVANGYREVVLSGVDLTDYGTDLPGRPRLGQMVRRLLAAVPGLDRLRLSSIDVAEVDATLMDLIRHEPRLMPHVHLSMQAGDDMVLKRMKRRHTRDDALRFVETVRAARPDVAFGADLIAGFPTETDAMFANTLKLVDEADLAFLHVFPYSPRAGTPAAKMPQVPGPIRKDRAAQLRAAGERRLTAMLARHVGTTADVLVEQPRIGRTPHYAVVDLDRDAAPGSVVRAELTAAADGRLHGRIADRVAA